ncbi:hypothetical protein ACR6C2_00480 [Streptomyces sp. INA 01156]
MRKLVLLPPLSWSRWSPLRGPFVAGCRLRPVVWLRAEMCVAAEGGSVAGAVVRVEGGVHLADPFSSGERLQG